MKIILKSFLSFLFVVVLFNNSYAQYPNELSIPITKITKTEGGGYIGAFYLNVAVKFSTKKSKLIWHDAEQKQPIKFIEISNINYMEQDSFNNTMVVGFVADSTLQNSIKKYGAKEFLITIVPDKPATIENNILGTLAKSGIYLYENNGRHFYSVEDITMSNFTQNDENRIKIEMLNEVKIYKERLRGTAKDTICKIGKYSGITQSSILDITTEETLGQYFIYLLSEKRKYMGSYVPFIYNYLQWCNAGAIIDTKKL
jgi:hypothetical protein